MQQVSVAERHSTIATRSADATPTAPGNTFVINLTSSTTPVALTRPDHAGLKRFTFFVSRRREEGRERFRLHMGYFETQEEAEKLLDIVRGIYPGAWAGLAPGRGLAAAAGASRGGRTPEPERPAAPPQEAAMPPEPARARTVEPPALALVPDEGRRLPEVPADSEQQAAARSLSDIRAAIAALDEHAATAPVLQTIPELKAAMVIPTLRPVARQPAPAANSATERSQAGAELSDSATLRLLESGGAKPAPVPRGLSPPSVGSADTVKVQQPADRAKQSSPQEQPREEKPCYAVQLMWSVQPIAMAQVPQLAIFSAYTLYGAEGNRDGRRWYGLRLGFFTDAVSAKQVAHYVRADFSTVSVVPVTVRERDNAKLAAARTTGTIKATTPAAKAQPKPSEFAFIDGNDPVTIKGAKPAGTSPARSMRAGGAGRATRGAPGKRAKVRGAGRVNANARTKPMTLEQTLEILGASQLQVDDEAGASINDSGVRHLRLEQAKDKPSKLTRLFERLSERLGN